MVFGELGGGKGIAELFLDALDFVEKHVNSRVYRVDCFGVVFPGGTLLFCKFTHLCCR